jgi:hypothetical protein
MFCPAAITGDGATVCKFKVPVPSSVITTLPSVLSRFRVVWLLFNVPLFSRTSGETPGGVGTVTTGDAVFKFVFASKM